MGYGIHGLRITADLHKQGLFNGLKTVIELGSQDIMEPEYAQNLLKTDFSWQATANQINCEIFYRCLGFQTYKCIDADGRYGALVFDLNKNISDIYGYREQFDLVTNHGTTEHCFNQVNVFQNIHNLCGLGGLMIHGIPFYGYLNHGFYNYNPLFFETLAVANNYKMIGMYLNVNKKKGDLVPYSYDLMEVLQNTSSLSSMAILLFVVMRKQIEKEFKVPFDRHYAVSSLL
ncbi:hypothetical protein [Microcoleus sp. OTE_8_concoct_300]|uniref:hypothetical protein n=1 Tax=Microcoleus sp. OTE_8_concoct_300 TaxID=2964710 RepID=UPI00403F3F34